MYALHGLRTLSILAGVRLGLLPLTLALIGSHKQKSSGLMGIFLGLLAPKAKMNVISDRHCYC